MSRREELDKLMADTRERFSAIVAASLEEISTVRQDADEKVRRYQEARASLDTVEGQIAALEAERDALPGEAYRANLAEDSEREAELRARFREIPGELDRLSVHRDRLRGELAGLRSDPAHPDPELDALRVKVRQTTRPASVAHTVHADLESFRKELAEALENSVERVESARRSTRQRVESLDSLIDDRTSRRKVLG